MKYLFPFILSVILLSTSCTKDRTLISTPSGPSNPGNGNGVLIDYWNFNGSSLLTPTRGNGSLNIPDTYDAVTSTATSINAQNGDVDGSSLRVRNPSTEMIIAAPTTGYENIMVSYAVEASSTSNAALTNTVSYTIDGNTYTTTGLSGSTYDLTSVIDPLYVLKSFDFSSIPGVKDNPNFKIKITFSNGNQNTSGNDRFDNITVKGTLLNGNTGGSKPVISSALTASGTVGTAFTYSVAASNIPTSFALTGNIPAGLSINTSTGVISGTPTVNGIFVDTVKAINTSGTGTQVLTITITSAAAISVVFDYWNFNGSTLLAPTAGNGSLIVPDTYDAVTSTAGSINAQNGDADGSGLRVRNPSTSMIIAAPTTGYNNIVVSYAVEASSTSNAALTNTISYTINGTDYITTGLLGSTYDLTNIIDPLYVLKSLDFSSISGVANNPNFKIKITFSNGNQNTSGNNRFDNITVSGVHE